MALDPDEGQIVTETLVDKKVCLKQHICHIGQ